MKKNLIVIVLTLFSLTVYAQKEEFAVIYTTKNCALVKIGPNAEKLIQSHTLLEDGKGKIVLKPDVTEIIDDFFYNSDLTSIIIPKGITSIGRKAFKSCWNLKSISIPEGVVSIGEEAFYECTLNSINLPATITEISGAFWGCVIKEFKGKFASNDKRCIIIDGKLSMFALANPNSDTVELDTTSYSIPNNVTSIGDYAFCQSGIKNVLIPNSVKSIGMYAFAGCRNLIQIIIPESVLSIGENAFYRCDELKNIYCKSVKPMKISDDTFDGCKIYVPRQSVEMYKEAEGWRDYADMIEPYDFK